MHQLRVHLHAIGHPIIGDRWYGGPRADRLILHAVRLRFPHPDSGRDVSVEAPLPEGFRLNRAGSLFQGGGGWLGAGIAKLKCGQIPSARNLAGLRQSGKGINRRLAGHGNGPFGHLGNRAGRCVRDRDTSLPPADQHTQAKLGRFRRRPGTAQELEPGSMANSVGRNR